MFNEILFLYGAHFIYFLLIDVRVIEVGLEKMG